ncbi:MAG: hypothetical protein NVS1B4_05800 [Gemmatimonadaceae bacterium]
MAIGGGVYPSTLARVRGPQMSLRDYTYDVRTTADTAYLDYRELATGHEPTVAPIGAYGLGLPAYDRSHGLSVPLGVVLSLHDGAVHVQPSMTYRSQLGALDPSVSVRIGGPDASTYATLKAQRGPATNDRWIRSDIINSLTTLYSGTDTRNYSRADQIEVTVARLIETPLGEWEPAVGLLLEDARSVGPLPGTTSRPWTALSRGDRQRILRPNPPVTPGRITSAVAAVRTAMASGGVTGAGSVRVEVPFDAPDRRRYVQTTLNAEVGFPTFATQTFELRSHVVHTAGDAAPPQRYAYLGGTGTLPTFDLLQFGGDQLFFAEGVYVIPLEFWRLPIAGAPAVSLRYMVGGAGVRSLPRLEQNIGLGAALSFVEVELLVEPAARTRQLRVGFSIMR